MPKRIDATKGEIVLEIAALLGVPAPPMSTGSTEPREIFLLIDKVLGLGIDLKKDKPGLARAIAEAAGYSWSPAFESRGSTVTRDGLMMVLHAVLLFVGETEG